MQTKRLLATATAVATFGGLGAVAGVAPPTLARPAAARPAAAPVIDVRPDVIPFTSAPRSAPPTTRQCEEQLHVACYSPAQLRQAYGLPKLYAQGTDGAGQTIVIVDSFGSPTIRQDLAAFDRGFHLSAPPSLKIIQPAGKVPPYQPTGTRISWAFETSLDVEYAHVVAPQANILLVETPVAETTGTGGFPPIVKAENYVVRRHLGDVISQSFSTTEQSFASSQALLNLRSAYIAAARAHITVLSASGDDGPANVRHDGTTFFLHDTVNWPTSDPLVTGVGGTQLHLNAAGNRTDRDNVWNDTYNVFAQRVFYGDSGPNPLATTGGKSVVFARPSWQNGVAGVTGSHRGVPDISMSAACDGSAIIHIGFPGLPAGFTGVCGTSESSPLFAGIVALADQQAGHPLGVINPALYQMLATHAPGLVPVPEGNNTVTFSQGGRYHTLTGFAGSKGYSLATGVGTVYAPDFVPELAHLAG